MCGLIFNASSAQWPALISANLSRAGTNKGALSVTPMEFENGLVRAGDTVEIDTDARDRIRFDIDGAAITHLQAPTSKASLPHPIVISSIRPPLSLWHNGLLLPSAVAAMQKITGSSSEWDTELIAEAVAFGWESKEFAALWEQEGSWACIVCAASTLYAFRNPLSPLFTDGLALSSVPLGAVTTPLAPGRIYALEYQPAAASIGWKATTTSFKCTHNPYGI